MAKRASGSRTARPRPWSSYRGTGYRLGIDPISGLPAVSFLGGGCFRALDAAAVIQSDVLGTKTIRFGSGRPSFQAARRSEIRLESPPGAPLHLAATYRFAAGGFRVRCALSNHGAASVRVLEVRPLEVQGGKRGWKLPGGTARWRAFKHGWCTSSPSAAVPMESGEKALRLRFPPARLMPGFVTRMIQNEGEELPRPRGSIRSEWVLGLEGKPGFEAVAIGFLGFRKHFSPIVIDLEERSLRAIAQADGILLDPGESFETEELWVGFGRSGREELEKWADLASSALPRKPPSSPIALWCSWYSGLYGSVDERSFLANLAPFRRAWQGDAYFQLDDGYESAIGDWLECNGKFPSGLEAIARQVRSEGFKPGIWLAPFCAEKRSRLFREHPDWLVRSQDGPPHATGFIPGPGSLPRLTYSLDTTNPDFLDHIRCTVKTLAGWGYELFKVDFLTAAAAAGVRRDPKATRAEAYARGMAAVRAGAGDRPITAAIAPLVANAGWVDIQRVGPDVAFGRPAWRKRWQAWANDRMSPGVGNNLDGSFARYFFDGRLWMSDPDAIVWEGLGADERRTLVTADLLLGGCIAIGHDFSKGPFDLSPIVEILSFSRERIDYADLFEPEGAVSRLVRVRARKDGLPYLLIALFNFGGRTETRKLTMPEGMASDARREAGLRDFWDPAAGPWRAGDAVPIPARGCRLFALPLATQGGR